MYFETFALIFYIVLVILGLITVWMGFPGTMLVLGGSLVYDLFVRSTQIPWQAYIIMFALLGIGEILDVVMTSYWKKPQMSANIMKIIIAIAMIVVFVLTL
ncbi:hypothetical protein ACFL96_13890 [Thermoproteota archaeon]